MRTKIAWTEEDLNPVRGLPLDRALTNADNPGLMKSTIIFPKSELDGKSGDRTEAAEKPRRRHRATGKPRGGRLVAGNRSFEASVERERVYSPEIAQQILERIEAGETLEEICRSSPDFPDPRNVRRWKYAIDGFAFAYARAREIRAEVWEDDLTKLANDRSIDPSVRRVEFDMKKWLMSKSAPQIYGDKLTLAGDPNAPLQHHVELEGFIRGLSAPERAALGRFLDEVERARDAKSVDGAENPPDNSGNSAITNRKGLKYGN
jgi:hypothetical protein